MVAQTSLHEAYPPGSRHVLPYPFGDGALDGRRCRRPLARALALPARAVRGAARHAATLSFVPIDFTQAGDGFEPADYGREALIERPDRRRAGCRGRWRSPSCRARAHDAARKRDAHILGFALAAGASDALPRRRHRRRADGAGGDAAPARPSCTACSWDKRAYAEFAGALGAGTLVRTASSFGIRQLVKLIPVYGQTAGAAAAAAASFAATYAMGKAAELFPDAPPAGRARPRRSPSRLSRGAAATPSAWPRSATSAAHAAGAKARERRADTDSASRASCCWPWRCCCRRSASFRSASLWLWQHGYIVYWAHRHLHRRGRRLLPASGA